MLSGPLGGEQHEAVRATVKGFVDREILPHVEAWEEASRFPRSLYKAAGDLGLLGIGFPEAYGGVPADTLEQLVVSETIARCGAGGVVAGLMSHGIGAPPIANLGSEATKNKYLPGILAGDLICALAITEPSGGSDVANLKTTARRDGDHYVLHGSKAFITSGMRADAITVAVRTGGEGLGGVSLIVVDGDAPGLERTEMKKMGWWCSDTAMLYFEDCRVPAENLLGPENSGFLGIMQNFNAERLSLAAMAYGMATVCYDEALAWAKQRETFGRPLVRHQVVRHKLVDMATAIMALRAQLERIAWQVDAGTHPIADVCMTKNLATQTLELCAKESVQILGGAGYLRGTAVERIYRETKVLSIGGGAEEIMKELAAKQLGIV